MAKKYSNIKYYFIFLLGIGFFVFFAGCRNEDFKHDNFDDNQNIEINFTGLLGFEDEVSSRANSTVYDITYQYFPCNFYIALMKDKTENINNLVVDSLRNSMYYIPAGASGSLSPATDQISLNWINRIDDHYFNAWTVPWNDFREVTEEDAIYYEGYEFDKNNYKDCILVPFNDTRISDLKSPPTNNQNWNSHPWNEDSWKNGKLLEQFVGCRMGPYKYIDQGAFVPLQFRHLASKICLSGNDGAGFVIIDNINGTTYTTLKGEITFFGLPKEVPFYPLTTDQNGNFIPPRMATPSEYGWKYDKTSSVTYAVTNFGCYHYTAGDKSSFFKDCWYFPPEIDLRKLSFKITIYEFISGKGWQISTSHGNHGSYYGDLSKIVISRTNKGDNYDETDDDYVLHGGEFLTLSFNLYERGEPSLRGIVSSWDNFQERDASQHVEKGIYSLGELKEFSDLMSSSNLTDDKLERRDEFYEMHGGGTTAEDPDGVYGDYEPEKKIVKLYEDIGTETAYNSNASSGTAASSTYKMTSTVNVADGYILDGQGHTINFYSTNLTLGLVRDVYLRYYAVNNSTSPATYIEYIVYIDKKGNVFTVDPETYQETPTGFNVNNAGKNPYTLNLSTGEIS